MKKLKVIINYTEANCSVLRRHDMNLVHHKLPQTITSFYFNSTTYNIWC